MSPHEVSTLVLFLALVLVWLLRRPGFMPGWADTLQWTNEEGENHKHSSPCLSYN